MTNPNEQTAERRPLRLPTEMPRPAGVRDSRALGLGVSVLVHVVIVLALVLPFVLSPTVRSAIARGAGGAGPAGGGGGSGGARGVMGDRERLRFVRVAPEAQAPPKAEEPKPAVVPPPQPQVQPQPQPTEPPRTDPNPEPQADQLSSATGPGTGGEGSGGAGPGSGGGVGSGIGTGRGSGLGPGTGGGADSVYPPTMVETFLPPYPVPAKIRPFVLVASFEVDSTGKVLALEFNESRDRSYNRKLRETLAKIRFRPGVRADGTPIRTRYELRYDM